jgi:DNA-binding CsgD family transcriptional regulator/tetratricopeptide (TPR) repeat protein
LATSTIAESGLLERERELEVLTDAFASTGAGSAGALVLVHGEAGVGKTAVLQRFCRTREPATRILWGTCESLFTARPLGPFLDVAEEIGGKFQALVTGGALPHEVATALSRELSGGPPAILVVEDLHWADEATLDVVRLLGRRIDRVSALVVATYRSDELSRTHPLRVVLGDLTSAVPAFRLQLDPLSPTAVAELARPYGMDAEDLYAKTAGNPFFVTEALAGDRGEVPATVRDAVLARAARLGPKARDLLDAVAVTPPRSELWLLEAIAGESMGGLDECFASGMLRLEERTVSFRHELARLAVEESIEGHRHGQLHGAALLALRSSVDANVSLARLAHHAEAAGDAEAVLEFAPAAAENAAALGARREAAAQYARALRFAGSLTGEKRAELLDRLAYASYVIGEFEAAIDAEQAAVEYFRRADNPLREGDALRSLSRLLRYIGRSDDAMRVGREAVAILEGQPPSRELALAYANLSHLHQHLENRDETLEWAGRALELGDLEAEIYALTNIANARIVAGGSGSPELDRALSLALDAGLDEHAGRILVAFLWWSARGRRYHDADRNIERALELCSERGLELWRLFVFAFQSRLQLDRDQWDDAADSASVVLRDPRSAPVPRVTALSVAGLVRARRGDPDAWPLLEEAWTLAEPTRELQRVGPAAAGRAEAAWLEGRADAVVEATEDTFALALQRDAVWIVGELACWRRRAGVREELPVEVPDPWAAELRGDHARAARCWADLHARYDAAIALAESDSEDLLRRALGELNSLGARPAAAIVARRLRNRGARGVSRGPRPSTSENPVGLTKRELEVLALLSGGLRNAEIADRLILSRRTIDHHVSAILRKLAVQTRAQASAEALRLGLTSQDR